MPLDAERDENEKRRLAAAARPFWSTAGTHPKAARAASSRGTTDGALKPVAKRKQANRKALYYVVFFEFKQALPVMAYTSLKSSCRVVLKFLTRNLALAAAPAARHRCQSCGRFQDQKGPVKRESVADSQAAAKPARKLGRWAASSRQREGVVGSRPRAGTA